MSVYVILSTSELKIRSKKLFRTFFSGYVMEKLHSLSRQDIHK